MRSREHAPRHQAGFTLVELAVAIVIIGVLAAFGVPRFIKSIERSKAADAFDYLGSVWIAQERYQAQYGTYATYVDDLDIQSPSPSYFTVPVTFSPAATSSLQDSWTLTLTRTGASAGYGPYTVVFTETGFDPTRSTIARSPATIDINPVND